MDAVILAAGRGARLDGIAAPYHKPLLVVNGKPLITQAVDAAGMTGCTEITVVVAPENVQAISGILGSRHVHMIVQRTPKGPGDALLEGLEIGSDDRVLVLMSDNILDVSEVEIAVKNDKPTIGCRRLEPEEARRFTFRTSTGWVEGRDPYKEQGAINDGWVTVWCGPLVAERKAAWEVLSQQRLTWPTNELKIGPHLNDMGLRVGTVFTSKAHDIGVPEAVA